MPNPVKPAIAFAGELALENEFKLRLRLIEQTLHSSPQDAAFRKATLALLIGLFAILSSLVGISAGLLLEEYHLSLQMILASCLPGSILFFLMGLFVCRLVVDYVFPVPA